MLEDFKIKGQRISRKEKLYLDSLNLKWCNSCKKAKEMKDFYKNISCCKICANLKTYNCKKIGTKFYENFYSKENEEKRKKSQKERSAKYRKSLKYKLWRKLWKKNKRSTNPIWKLKENLRSSLSRIKTGEKNKKTLTYIGVDSIEQFIFLMSEKTNNKNWLQDDYHIDHIWQLQWFDDYMKKNPEFILSLVNHHSNLRPLEAKYNISRDKYDFSPLKKEDFEKFKPFLDIEISEKIQFFFMLKEKEASFSEHR